MLPPPAATVRPVLPPPEAMSGSPGPDDVTFDSAQEISPTAWMMGAGDLGEPEVPTAMSGSPRPKDQPSGAHAHSPSPDRERSRRLHGAATPQPERSRSLSRDWPSPPRRSRVLCKGDGKGKMPGGDRIGGPSQVTCRHPFCTGRYFEVFVRDPDRPEDAELFCSRCGGDMALDIQTRWFRSEMGRVFGRAEEAMQIAHQEQANCRRKQ